MVDRDPKIGRKSVLIQSLSVERKREIVLQLIALSVLSIIIILHYIIDVSLFKSMIL